MSTNTEAHDVAELARQAAGAEEIQTGAIYLIADADGGVRQIDTGSLADRPRRKGSVATGAVVANIDSFGAYLDKHGIADETEITASVEAGKFTAVINAGTDELPGWGDHNAVLRLTPSAEWARWVGASGRLMDQAAFAEFIEDNAANIVQPASAEILEIAQSLQVRRGVEFESGNRLQDGNVRFGYRETTTATAGEVGQLEIPATFTLALRPFHGGDPYSVTAAFRYRLVQKQLQLGFKLQHIERIREDAFNAIAEDVEAKAAAGGYLYLTTH